MRQLLLRTLACLALTAPLLTPQGAAAQTLFGVVSERSAPALAAGADRYVAAHPADRLILRTPTQLAELSDDELLSLWRQADSVLLAAVFDDDAVARLLRLMQQAPRPDMLAVHSDRRLVRHSRLNARAVFAGLDQAAVEDLHDKPEADQDPTEHRQALAERYPGQAEWLRGQAYWRGRDSGNMAQLLAWLNGHPAAAPQPQAAVRYYQHGEVVERPQLSPEKPLVAALDLDSGDEPGNRGLLDELCRQIERDGEQQCLVVLASWGAASHAALQRLRDYPQLSAVVSLQDFVIGGGERRSAATDALIALDVPVFKGIRLVDRSLSQWRIAEDGMPWDSVHYQLAMPELQGISQPLLLSAAGPARIHAASGLRLRIGQPVASEIALLAERARRWSVLQRKANADKKLALIYYNHPPGRHNVGADNLDVPASLWDILHRLQAAGYHTGELPESPEALLELIQQRGINLPEDHQALRQLHAEAQTLSGEAYRAWFDTLPKSIRAEMVQGPLGYLQAQLRRAHDSGELELAQRLLARTFGDLHHLLEGVRHEARGRALDLLEQLQALDEQLLAGESEDWDRADTLVAALTRTGIEGLRGWGEPPGRVMTYQGDMLLPGLRFGNIFIGPQPPRGWEINEELLHANTTIPPTHQYLGFYHWLRDAFGADALVHLGRHSTYEFLPRRRAALGEDDYPRLVAGAIPGIYPYIVDGVGEGLQAKRRGLAVIINHLTPPLKATPLYDRLLELRQLVESWEAADAGGDSALRDRAMRRIRALVEELELSEELVGTIAREHGIDGLTYDNVDEAMLVHEIGHYLTDLQEAFMPHGLHVFGRDWEAEPLELMLESIDDEAAREPLASSPAAERRALLAALEGRFIEPGKGNDPVRSPETLPTGRNFHALDGGVMPTKLAYELGLDLAATARADSDAEGRSAVVLWASDTVRDEGAMVAFGLGLLGIKPVWNSRGIVTGLEPVDIPRRDVLFTTSGLFRDLYPNLLVWLDRAVLLALDGASRTIVRQHPELTLALEATLAQLGELRAPGAESLEENRVAAHWVADTRARLASGEKAEQAGPDAALRIFGDAPGAYGAGVNRLVERSGAWQDRSEVADAYLQRMGHAYGVSHTGSAAHDSFRRGLAQVRHTYLGRASNLYGLLDNNDAFDYLGGLSLAVETVAGKPPQGRVIQHANADDAHIERLETALLQELRGRFLNPAWLEPLMHHGYAGARTMGSEFLEYLWGWQVTNPDIIKSWAWDEVKRVYLDDGHELGLDEFLAEGRNVHVKANMQAILLVAAHKGYWEADPADLDQVAQDFAELVVAHGLPGSGHTRPDHPMLEWIQPRLDEALRARFQAELAAARGPSQAEPLTDPSRITELRAEAAAAEPAEEARAARAEPADSDTDRQQQQQQQASLPWQLWSLLAGVVVLLIGGIIQGMRRPSHVR
ncbi:cobaltochelatase subunit CobN [Alkalilimnicola sp. S0819]|uniref:cobaltochelatase subunit CobN n=1 Tax=Alkalilimnicola sp. S0819 TaxID=2613922 RepID=UPI0012619F9E|nr:cobaltochelatase subunit CobN [Alkalilimnicola sp. S0819]KAB7623381.1 cobaltochelatase subunit CobN [Alkalilimnicola sp. S0819]MPQ16923.1 cobaltochelatase subunit CobN [Alkalilimnicola sp. S0819]